jgi:hypothetical protein
LFAVLFERWARAVDESAASQTPRLIIEMAAVDLCAAEPLLPIGDLLERLEDLEARLRGSGGAPPPRQASPPPPAAPPSPGPRSWASPPPAAPAPRAPAPPPPRAEPAPAPARSAEDAWRTVLSMFEKKPTIGMRLANANVSAFERGTLTLAFPDRAEADRVEKSRAEIEEAVSKVVGQPTKLSLIVAANSVPTLVRSEVGAESDAVAADKKTREVEARQHPLIQKAQDIFNASLKEVKTP